MAGEIGDGTLIGQGKLMLLCLLMMNLFFGCLLVLRFVLKLFLMGWIQWEKENAIEKERREEQKRRRKANEDRTSIRH